MHLYSAFSYVYVQMRCTHTAIYFTQRTDQNSGCFVPYSLPRVCGFFKVPCYKTEDTGDGTYGLGFFFLFRLERLTICSCNYKKITICRCNYKKCTFSLILTYFKTLSVGPVWGSKPQPPAQQSGALPTTANQAAVNFLILFQVIIMKSLALFFFR